MYQKLLQRDCSGPSASASGKGPSVSAKEAGKETGKIEGFELRELFLYERTVLDKLGFHYAARASYYQMKVYSHYGVGICTNKCNNRNRC